MLRESTGDYCLKFLEVYEKLTKHIATYNNFVNATMEILRSGCTLFLETSPTSEGGKANSPTFSEYTISVC